MLANVTPTFKYYFCLHANETLSRLEQTPKLVIAAINGHCVGGGFEIAMAADMRIARRNAGKMGLPEVSLGVLPGTGGTQRLTRLVGKSKAIEIMGPESFSILSVDWNWDYSIKYLTQRPNSFRKESRNTLRSLLCQTRQRAQWAESSAACKLVRRFLSKQGSHSNVSCNNNSSNRKTLKKDWMRTSTNGKRSLKVNNEW